MNKQSQHIGIKGMITVRRYKAGTIDAARAILARHGKFATDKLAELFAQNFLGIGARNSNLIVSSANHGRNIIAQQLGGITTYALPITYAEMGSGSTAPANSDTALTTSVARQSADAVTVANNVVDIQFFFSDSALPNGTYNEFGTFCGGTATLGSGQLFNHALFSPSYVKTSGEDTTIDVEFTIN
jgi:hypothetical protein